jgi:uncharacterized membrane protein YhfC
MDILFVVHFLNGFLMIAIPVGLAVFLISRWKTGGNTWWIGAAAFILSQIAHIPFNWGIGKLLNQTGLVAWNPMQQLIFNAVFLGLSAGIFEEGTRYLVLLWWAKDMRSWRNGVLFGAGHGGAEAIILGGLVIYGFIQMAALRNTDLSKVIQASQLAIVQSQVAAYWSTPWYDSLIGALERIFTIPCQIAMAILVMQAFTRKDCRWLLLAIGYHALLDASVVISGKLLGMYLAEVIIFGFAALSLFLIFVLRQPESIEESYIAPGVPEVRVPEPVNETLDNLEKTRYQ